MELRTELQPPPVDPRRLAEIGRHVRRILDLQYHGEPADEEFALDVARPVPRVPDVTRDEPAEIVRRAGAGNEDSGYYARLFEANVTRPGGSDLIFHPPAELRNVSAEELVDWALSHRPIAL